MCDYTTYNPIICQPLTRYVPISIPTVPQSTSTKHCVVFQELFVVFAEGHRR